MKTLVAILLLASVVGVSAADDITDPSGEIWEAGTEGWYFWAGFGVGCTFYGFTIVKRVAVRVAGSVQDY